MSDEQDQISWFEADAVCQFHHSNLITVTNSLEFDASREFLRILDVTEPVWVGLMRSQNSDRFFWSNSKPLGANTEYWAESLPVIDAPLCAVIDPVRDYRWHALRCGGPETASFLCEMNVPNWAEECVIRDIPSLTIQYMADSGTVEITKDCGHEEGIIYQICRGKQDLEKIINNLVCKNEKLHQIWQNYNYETQNSNIINSNILNSHKKSIEIIRNAQTDNNEDNNISIQNNKKFDSLQEKLSEKETENPVQKLIEQFDVEELMQADQPQKDLESKQEEAFLRPSIFPDEIITTITTTIDIQDLPKRQSKNAKLGGKKSNKKFLNREELRKQAGKNIAVEDMMMGDQPFIPFDVIDNINEIQEPLPYSTKMLPQDLKHEDKSLSEHVQGRQSTMLTTDISLRKIHSTISEPFFYTESVEDRTIKTEALPIATTSKFKEDDTSQLNASELTPTQVANEDDFNISSAAISENIFNSLSSTKHKSFISSQSKTVSSNLLTPNANSPEYSTTVTSPHDSVTTTFSTDTKFISAVTIGHPMHPQQPRSNVISEETVHQHIKESSDNHFIPPMLMVKSHYQSPKLLVGHNAEHQPDSQIVIKKTSPSDSNSNADSNRHLVNQSTDFPATNLMKRISEFQNIQKNQKLESTNDSLSENVPAIQPALQINFLTTLKESEQNTNDEPILTTSASKSEIWSAKIKNIEDNSKLKSQVTPSTTIAPNKIIEIKLSNDSSENSKTISISTKPTTSSSSLILIKDYGGVNSQIITSFGDRKSLTRSPSHQVTKSPSLPMTPNFNFQDSIKIDGKTVNSINVSEVEILFVNPSSLVVNKSSNTALKDFSPILTTIIKEPSSSITSSQETLKNYDDELLTTSTTKVPDNESITFTTQKRRNLSDAVLFSEAERAYEYNIYNYDNYNNKFDNSDNNNSSNNNNNNNENNNNTNNNDEKQERLNYEVSNKTTIITGKSLVPIKKTIITKKDYLKNEPESLSSSFVVLTTVTSSPSALLSSIEEELERKHNDTKISTTTSDIYTSDEETFPSHKPNRRRSLTKPETTSYLKKILG